MTQEAKHLAYEGQIQMGTIEKCHHNSFSLIHNLSIIQAKKATSCLLVPEEGDKVAFLQVNGEEYYILHILERTQSKGKLLLPHHTRIEQEEQSHSTYTLPHDLQNELHETGLKLYTKNTPSQLEIQCDTCALSAKESLEFHSDSIKECAKNINLTSHHTTLTGATLTTRFKSLRTFCDHAIDKVKSYIGFYGKKVEKVETLIDINAQRVNMNIEENLRLRSKRASLKSQENVDIDAKHINIG